MPARVRAVCIHGHYYQPPREHPWLGVVEPEPTAAPDHDWNARILRECYAPNAAARLLDARGRLRGVVDNYAWTSFDVGPTLDAWLGEHAPALIDDLVAADRASVARTGHGDAWAQAYNHPILPLCTPRDVRTQVRWGARAFALRFGRAPEGMWLPEMAVDLTTLEALAAEGIAMTMLSPHQARRVRALGGGATEWHDVTPATLDVRRVYACRLPSGGSVDVVFRHDEGSRGLAFGEWLRDGDLLADRVLGILGDGDADAMVTLATDGETFGHHHRFGEMAVAYAVDRFRRDETVIVTNPATFRATAPPTHEVQIVEETSWSCAHGVARWREGCACRVGGPPEWTTAWRRPLREAIDWLRDELGHVFESEGGRALRDPWAARDGYVEAVVLPERAVAVVTAELSSGATERDLVQARTALEMARHALLMQTSCGWFFDDVAGVEATIVLRQAGRAIDLARRLGRNGIEDAFVDRLRLAASNEPSQGTAADVYRRAVQERPVTPARIAATAVVLDRLDEPPALSGYELALGNGAEDIVVVVAEARTGARDEVRVRATPRGAPPVCEVDGRRYGVADLFLVQRAALLDKVAGDAVRAVREARHDALGRLRAVIDPLLGRQPTIPLDLAMLLGFEETDRVLALMNDGGTGLAALGPELAALTSRGVTLAVRRLTGPLTERLIAALARLPDGVDDALEVLELAETAGVVLDLEHAQTVVARWWQRARPVAPSAALARLRDRLDLSPELGAAGPAGT